jgi:hypothetical protein
LKNGGESQGGNGSGDETEGAHTALDDKVGTEFAEKCTQGRGQGVQRWGKGYVQRE